MDVANPKQIFLADSSRGARLKKVFMQVRQHDGIDGTRLLTIAAVDTFKEINIVSRGATRAVITLLGLYRDRQRWADGFAQFTGNTPFFSIGITPQRMQSTEPWGFGGLFLGILNRELLPEEVTPGYREPAKQFRQRPGF